VPADCEKISTEWLSHAVHAEVTGFKTRVCSEGQVAITVVLHDIEYAAPRDDRPSSLAIKMHPADEGARQFGYISGLFSQELYFYTSFCDKLPGIVVPEVYGIWSDGGRPGQDPIEFNALMMEDLTKKYEPYSVDKSPDAQGVEDIALGCIAPFHAAFFGKVDLEEYPQLDPGGAPGSFLNDFQVRSPQLPSPEFLAPAASPGDQRKA